MGADLSYRQERVYISRFFLKQGLKLKASVGEVSESGIGAAELKEQFAIGGRLPQEGFEVLHRRLLIGSVIALNQQDRPALLQISVGWLFRKQAVQKIECGAGFPVQCKNLGFYFLEGKTIRWMSL